MTDVWTVERIEKLKRLYDERYSFAEIAAALGGGITRNSAIGKAHRLGLVGNKAKPKPKLPKPDKPPSAQCFSATVHKINAAKAAPAPKVRPEPFVMQCAEVDPLGVSLMDLTDTTCRWPEGDQPPFVFCGNLASGPYCPAHARICYVPRQPRRSGPHPSEFGKARGGVFGRTA